MYDAKDKVDNFYSDTGLENIIEYDTVVLRPIRETRKLLFQLQNRENSNSGNKN